MNVRQISSLGLAPSMVDKLSQSGFFCVGDFISMKPLDLAREVGIAPEDALSILEAAKPSGGLAKSDIITALDVCQKSNSTRPIITFCRSLDKMIGGGIQIGQITEFCGVPGVGKTQIGIQICLDAQIPKIFNGNGGEAVYIDTEGSFMVERAAEMAQALSDHLIRISKTLSTSNVTDVESRAEMLRNAQSMASEKTRDSLLQGIHVYRAHDQTELLGVVNRLGTYLASHLNVRVVVLDSIAFHFRQDLQSSNNRARLLSSTASTLNQIAFQYNVAIVVINHITTRVTEGRSRILPALGEQWSHCITNRLMLQWEGGHSGPEDPQQGQVRDESTVLGMSNGSSVRTVTLVKSPSFPPCSCHYHITHMGIRDIPSQHKRRSTELANSQSTGNGNTSKAAGDGTTTGMPAQDASSNGYKRQKPSTISN